MPLAVDGYAIGIGESTAHGDTGRVVAGGGKLKNSRKTLVGYKNIATRVDSDASRDGERRTQCLDRAITAGGRKLVDRLRSLVRHVQIAAGIESRIGRLAKAATQTGQRGTEVRCLGPQAHAPEEQESEEAQKPAGRTAGTSESEAGS